MALEGLVPIEPLSLSCEQLRVTLIYIYINVILKEKKYMKNISYYILVNIFLSIFFFLFVLYNLHKLFIIVNSEISI